MVYFPSAAVTATTFVGQLSAGCPVPLWQTGSAKMQMSNSGILSAVANEYPKREMTLTSLNDWG